MKGGIIIPNINFITSLLNVTTSDIDKFDVHVEGDTTFYEVTLVRKPMLCPACGGTMIGHGHKLKSINHPIQRDTKCIIKYHANRYICKYCGKTAFEKNPFAFEGFNASFFQLRSVMKLLANLNYNLKMISEELNVSTTHICKYLDSYITIPPRPLPESIGIDEIHSKALSRKNSSYLCVIVDNVKRDLYEVLDTRNKHQLSLFFSSFTREERLKVKYVTIDMWEPYKDVVKTYLPAAAVAVDPFHVIFHLTKGFERLRINLMRQCEYGSNAYYLLKQWHWLLEKDNVQWDNEKVYNHRFKTKLNHRDIFEMIMETFPVLQTAYDLKEQYRWFNRTASYDYACKNFISIASRFRESNIPEYQEFTSILYTWKEEIINSFMRPYDDRKLSNSFTENVNGRIRTYLSVSKGVNNFKRFRKRILYALSSGIYYAINSTLLSDQNPGKPRGHYNKIRD